MFHFAGIGDIVPSIERPTEYMATNVQGTVRVLECARAGEVRRSSSTPRRRPATASPPCRRARTIRSRPQYPYALSKYLGETGVLALAQVYRLPVNSIRIFNAYGPRVRTTGAYGAVFGVFFRQKLAGKPFTVVGDGTQRRDFLYVTDVAEAFLRAAESDFSGRDLQPRRRQPAEREPAGRTARRPGRAYSEAAGRAGLHLGGHRARSRAISAGSRWCRSSRVSGA